MDSTNKSLIEIKRINIKVKRNKNLWFEKYEKVIYVKKK